MGHHPLKAGAVRRGAAKRWAVLAAGVLVLSLPGAVADAHGGGTLRTDQAGPHFDVVVETNEQPNAGPLGGTIHVTTIVTAPDSRMRLRHVPVRVEAVGPAGERVGPQTAMRMLNGAYEADLSVSRPGRWRVRVEVGEAGRQQHLSFDLDVRPRPIVTDLGVVGGLILVPILALAGLLRAGRPGRRG